jgi:hypothetical protein
MRHSLLLFICLGLLLSGSAMLLGALEVDFKGGINYMTYHPDREIPHNLSENHSKFQEYNYGFGDLSVKDEFSGNMGYKFHLSRDNILRNTATISIMGSNDYLSAHFGPYMGMTDDFEEKPELGITGGMQLALPGVVFVAFNGSTTFGMEKFDFLGNNSREVIELKFGFWLPNLIISASYSTKNYSDYTSGDITSVRRDELERFQASADIFIKDFPFGLRIDAGLEYLRRTYEMYETTDELEAYFVGAEVWWQAALPVRVIAGIEIPLLFDAKEQVMEVPDSMFQLFKFHAGISLKFF